MTVEDTAAVAPVQYAGSLVDLLDRLLGVGVVLSGDVTISLAGVDLVTVRLRALVTTALEERR
jgi:Gas vesicle protein